MDVELGHCLFYPGGLLAGCCFDVYREEFKISPQALCLVVEFLGPGMLG